jgi:hypothetical protein
MKGLKFEVARFKRAVASGDIEKRREAENKLREAFAELGLDTSDINYLLAGWKRAVEIEQAYQKRCEEFREIRELVAKAYRILF